MAELALALHPTTAGKTAKAAHHAKADPTSCTNPATSDSTAAVDPFAALMAKAAPAKTAPAPAADASKLRPTAAGTSKAAIGTDDQTDESTPDDDEAPASDSKDPLGDAIDAGLTAILALAPSVTSPVLVAKATTGTPTQPNRASTSASTPALTHAALAMPGVKALAVRGATATPAPPAADASAGADPVETAPRSGAAAATDIAGQQGPALPLDGPLGDLVRALRDTTAAVTAAPSGSPAAQSVPTGADQPVETGVTPASVSASPALPTSQSTAGALATAGTPSISTAAMAAAAAMPSAAPAANAPTSIAEAANAATRSTPSLNADTMAATASAVTTPSAQPGAADVTIATSVPTAAPADAGLAQILPGAARAPLPSEAAAQPGRSPAPAAQVAVASGSAVPAVEAAAQRRDTTEATIAVPNGTVTADGTSPIVQAPAKAAQHAARVDQRTATPTAIGDSRGSTPASGGRADSRASNDRAKDRDNRNVAGHDAPRADAAVQLAAATTARTGQAIDGAASPLAGAGAPTVADAALQQQLNVAQDGQWLDQLTRDIVSTAGSGNDLNFKLSPAHLGALAVSISQGADGAAVRMTTDSADTRTMLIDAQPKLVAEARAQGLKISETHVDLSHQQQGGSGSASWSGGSNASAQQQQAGGQQQRQPLPDRQPFSRNTAPSDSETASPGDSDALYA